MRERSILHFNVADFAVAVERIQDPCLREKPIVIAPMGASRGLVHDMSEEAYHDGVRKGMPIQQAMRRCKSAVLLTPRPDLYQRAMGAFFKELQGYSPLIESGQTDGHFFVDVTGTHRLYGPAPDVGWRVRRDVRKQLGINPIWALGSNRLVSKVASRLVKPVGEYIVTPGDEASFLAPLPIDILPGLRAKELEKMREFRLTTIGALAQLGPDQLMVPFGRRCQVLHALSQGVDDTIIDKPSLADDIVAEEYNFADDTSDRREIEAVMAALVGRVGHVLRGQKKVTRRVGLWLRYSDGGEMVRQASHKSGTSSEFLLQSLALLALKRCWQRRTRIRSCRLVCDRLQRESPQLSLFAAVKSGRAKEEKVTSAMDSIRTRFGSDSIGVGRKYLSS
ncbi:DNA polymerase Y family protein [Desulforhopalus sp. 52FAK]